MEKQNDNSTEDLKFEDALKEVESIVDRLESGELPLEESLQTFQRGMELVNLCSKKIDKVEEKLRVLLENADGGFTLKDGE